MKAKIRFEKFRQALADETGDKAIELKDGSVMVMPNEFSPAETFKTLQRAIDHYARYMPDDLNETP